MTRKILPAPREVVDAGPVVVTGAGGFLGVNLVWALREHGFKVRALMRRPPASPAWQGLQGVEFVQGDVRDAAAMDKIVEGAAYVIHGAALTELVTRPRRLAFQINVEGTRNVCASALRSRVRRLVLLSTAATVACGTADAPATEMTPYNLGAIRAPYYTSKRQAEAVVSESAARGLETIILCPAYVLGPRDIRPTTNQLLIYLSRFRWPFVGPGGLNVIDVRETALAHVRALWLGEPRKRYLLGGPYRAYAELGRIVQQITGTQRHVRILPRWARWVGSAGLALAEGVLPRLPPGLSLASFQYSFVPVHVSGARGDEAFRLHHRSIETTVYETLLWFQQIGLAPWLTRPLLPPAALVEHRE